MQCPQCKHRYTHVYATKNLGVLMKRYRRCLRCGHSFKTTEEIYVTQTPTTLCYKGRTQ